MSKVKALILSLVLVFPFISFVVPVELSDTAPFGPSHSHGRADTACRNWILNNYATYGPYSQGADSIQHDCWVSVLTEDGNRHIHAFTSLSDITDLERHEISAEQLGKRVITDVTIWDTRTTATKLELFPWPRQVTYVTGISYRRSYPC